jgi:hypothetical protein
MDDREDEKDNGKNGPGLVAHQKEGAEQRKFTVKLMVRA